MYAIDHLISAMYHTENDTLNTRINYQPSNQYSATHINTK